MKTTKFIASFGIAFLLINCTNTNISPILSPGASKNNGFQNGSGKSDTGTSIKVKYQ